MRQHYERTVGGWVGALGGLLKRHDSGLNHLQSPFCCCPGCPCPGCRCPCFCSCPVTRDAMLGLGMGAFSNLRLLLFPSALLHLYLLLFPLWLNPVALPSPSPLNLPSGNPVKRSTLLHTFACAAFAFCIASAACAACAACTHTLQACVPHAH